MIIPVENVGQYGLVTDLPYDKIPLNAWTSGKNVRFRGGAVEKFFGYTEVFGQPLVAPKWLLHSSLTGSPLWLYAGNNEVGATDGATHALITRAGVAYSVLPGVNWSGGVLEGIAYINNGVDVPQMWNKPALSQKLEDLVNWPAGVTARTLRTFKRYLIALDVTKAGVRFPTMIKWSSQAPTGLPPASWATDDETIDAGEYNLPSEEGGILIDSVPLRDVHMLYRESQVWQMAYVGIGAGDAPIFRFNRLFEHIGVFSRDCVAEFFSGRHIVFTGDDIVLNEGQTARSIVSERYRKAINIDLTNYDKSFVTVDYNNTEVLVCFPESGMTWPNKAIVWNWVTDTFGIRELPNAGRIAAGIVVEGLVSNTWNTQVGVWDSYTSTWGTRRSDPTKRRLLMASLVDNKLYALGLTQRAGAADMHSFVERTDLGFPLRTGQPPDYTRVKQVLSLWPRITGSQGESVNVFLGTQQHSGGPVTWGSARAYTIGSNAMLDFSDSEAGRLHAVRVESEGNLSWKLSGYDVDVIDRGSF